MWLVVTHPHLCGCVCKKDEIDKQYRAMSLPAQMLDHSALRQELPINISYMLHAWYIYGDNWVFFSVNVSIHETSTNYW